MEGRLLCFHRQAAQADLCWHAARVETLDLIQHDEVVRLPSLTGLQHGVVRQRDGGTKTIMNNDVCLKGSRGSLTLIGRDGGRRACHTKQPPEKTKKD